MTFRTYDLGRLINILNIFSRECEIATQIIPKVFSGENIKRADSVQLFFMCMHNDLKALFPDALKDLMTDGSL